MAWCRRHHLEAGLGLAWGPVQALGSVLAEGLPEADRRIPHGAEECRRLLEEECRRPEAGSEVLGQAQV
jgi:hypothetical protein